MIATLLLEEIKEKFEAHTLPGREAQLAMAHANRNIFPEPGKDVNLAGVLVLLYPKGNAWHIVFIERASRNKNDRHRGQISFPGGRFEDGDEILQNTAVREAEEEVGVNAANINILGSLTDLYIPVSNFHVFPFVGYTEETPVFTPQLSEVKDILEVPVTHFKDPEIRQKTTIRISDHLILKDVPYFNIHGTVLWGATAMMLNEFLALIE